MFYEVPLCVVGALAISQVQTQPLGSANNLIADYKDSFCSKYCLDPEDSMGGIWFGGRNLDLSLHP